MKIKNKDLKKLYKAYLIENAPISRKNCPNTKDIINLLRAKLSEKQKSKIIDHITSCYFCSQEFEFILQTLRQEKKLKNEIENLNLNEKRIPLTQKKQETKKPDSPKKISSFYPAWSWKYAPILLGFALIIFLIFSLVIFRNHEKKNYRSTAHTQIKLIKPIKGIYQKSLLEFRWEEIRSVDYFILELFDESLKPIWKSNRIYNNNIVLPKKFIANLPGDNMYFWMVTAYFPDGKMIESRIEDFVLTK